MDYAKYLSAASEKSNKIDNLISSLRKDEDSLIEQDLVGNNKVKLNDDSQERIENLVNGYLKGSSNAELDDISNIYSTEAEKKTKEEKGKVQDDEPQRSQSTGVKTAENSIESLYEEILGRSSDPKGLEHWTKQMNSGMSLEEIRENFYLSPEFQKKALSSGDPVEYLYENILGRESDKEGYENYSQHLTAGDLSMKDIISGFLSSPEYDNLSQDRLNGEKDGAYNELLKGNLIDIENQLVKPPNLNTSSSTFEF